MKIALILCLVAAATLCNATVVRKCPNGPRKLTSEEVSISNCKSGTCKLRRNTRAEVEMKFTPETDVAKLTTRVNAIILGIPLPFIGVDGTSACNNVFAADGQTKVSCPLTAGTQYVYKNSFPIEEFYPAATLVVHWALESQKKDVACFEVPARIF